MARYLSYGQGKNGGWTEKAGELFGRAVSNGCDDPLAQSFSVRLGARYPTAEPKVWADAFVKAAQALHTSGYPPLRRFFASVRAAEYLHWAKAEWKDVYDWRYQAADQCTTLATDNSIPFSEVYLAVSALLECNNDHPKLAEKFFGNLELYLDRYWSKEPGLQVLKGRAAFAGAWRARGVEYAQKTSDEQWKGFREGLDKAESAFNQAWKADPTNEEIPTYMIKVVQGQGRERDEMELWFKRGMALDTNNYQACYAKLSYLQPKWFGSPDDLLAFGHECVASTNWGGWVPLILADAHEMLARYLPKESRSDYWKNPEVWKDIKASFEKYHAIYPQATDGHDRYARFAAWCEQWEEFARQVKQVPSINRDYFAEQGNFDDYVQAAEKAIGRSIW